MELIDECCCESPRRGEKQETSESDGRRRGTSAPKPSPGPKPTRLSIEDSDGATSEPSRMSETSDSATSEMSMSSEGSQNERAKANCDKPDKLQKIRCQLLNEWKQLCVERDRLEDAMEDETESSSSAYDESYTENDCKNSSDGSDGNETNDERCTAPCTACIAKATKTRPDQHWNCVFAKARFPKIQSRVCDDRNGCGHHFTRSVLDGVSETVTTQGQDRYLPGENVEVAVSGSQITAYGTTHLNGEGNPENTSLTEERKRHFLTLDFKNTQSFLSHMSIGNVWNWRR